MLGHQLVKLASGYAGFFRGWTDSTLVAQQQLFKISTFKVIDDPSAGFGQRQVSLNRKCGYGCTLPKKIRWKALYGKHGFSLQDIGPLHQIFEFPNISGPMVLRQSLLYRGMNGIDGFLELTVQTRQE